MKYISYTNFVLTVIAALLAWNIVIRTNQPVVHAQNAPTQFAITGIADPSELSDEAQSPEKSLNNAVKGGEIVAVATRRNGGYFVVYKPQK
jgi:hypothetical protein